MKNNKGITLIAVVLTTIIMLIIAGTVVYNSTGKIAISSLENMNVDIDNLKEQCLLYYAKYQALPIKNDVLAVGNLNSSFTATLTAEDLAGEFYVIDLSKLDNVSLNYGKGFATYTGTEENLNDIYIINNATHNIFYLNGIQYEGNTYYAKSTKTVDLNNTSNKVCTVTFNNNGGTGTMQNQTVYYNIATNLEQSTFSKTGYVFCGWNTKADGTGKRYASEGKIKISQDTMLYAQWIQEVYNFDYVEDQNENGYAQTFTVPVTGVYKLECWGAQGGSHADISDSVGGYGGYSVGDIRLNKNDTLYIFVGEEGVTSQSEIVGDSYAYPNGGAIQYNYDHNNNLGISYNGGGGSTHIAKENKLIENLWNNNNLLMVAGRWRWCF